MTHIAILGLFIILALRDLAEPGSLPLAQHLTPLAIALGTLLPFAAIALAVQLSMRSLGRMLDHSGAPAAAMLSGQVLDASRILTLLAHAWAVFVLGWLDLVRAAIGDWPAVDELLALAPGAACVVLGWGSYHPIDRRLREATLLGALDRGEQMPSLVPRGIYVWEQIRHNLLFVLVPVTILVAWWESLLLATAWAVERYAWAARAAESQWPLVAIHLCGVMVLAACMPLAIRHLWRTARLEAGPLRERLVQLGAAHGVGFRDVLVWRTHAQIANAAVIGLARPARYVLMTDTLLERLPLVGVEAVMAHEVAHARRHHIPWLMLGTVVIISLAFDGAAAALRIFLPPEVHPSLSVTGVWTLVAGAACIAALGFISRRFELQADAFAAQHLSGFRPGRTPRGAAPPITPEAAYTMIRSLDVVSRLNHSNPARFTLRHGSIRWRQHHLHGLIGAPADALPIDRTVRMIKRGILCGLAATIALALLPA